MKIQMSKKKRLPKRLLISCERNKKNLKEEKWTIDDLKARSRETRNTSEKIAQKEPTVTKLIKGLVKLNSLTENHSTNNLAKQKSTPITVA